jgi:taurine dioxygenase
MTERVLEPVGIEVTHTSVCDITDAEVHRLRHLLAEHGVAVLRDQAIDDDQFVAFLGRFGQPVFTIGEQPVPSHAELNIVSNARRSTPPRSVFHVDTSYVRRPPAYTALRAVQVPATGGDTLFTNQYRAYRTLSDDLQQRLAGRTVTHVVTGVDPGERQDHSAEHPIFRRHPLSGRVALYLSTPQRCVAISGMDAADGQRMIQALHAHSTAPDNVYRHRWRPGDVVMWDNGCVMHKADHHEVRGDRVLHRGMVDGYAAEPSCR